MQKKILITGATDGIGLETVKKLAADGHHLLIHGRNSQKLADLQRQLTTSYPDGRFDVYVADLSVLKAVNSMIDNILADHEHLDVLINNAGVYHVSDTTSEDGLDTRFVVNTIAPYLLAKRLLPILPASGRIVNVASAAQAPVLPEALTSVSGASAGSVYAQSKLAIIMWSNALAASLAGKGPVVVSLNPKSLLGSKMVREAYGINGASLSIGADILIRAALSEEFADASGKYFDNDIEGFSLPHQDATDARLNKEILSAIESVLARFP